jgi:hypothetical protein
MRLVVLRALVGAAFAFAFALLPPPMLGVQAQDPCTVATCEWAVGWGSCQPWNWNNACGGGGMDGDLRCNGETRTHARTEAVAVESRGTGATRA